MFNKRYINILWFISGLVAGIGYVFATFYILIRRKDPARWLSLMFLLGPFGSILVYLITRKEYKDLALVSLYLLAGFLVWVPISLYMGINPLYQIEGYVHGWLGI